MWVDLSAFEEPQEPVVPEEISVGDVVTFGSYEQDNNLENGTEPIEWQVLDVQDGKALVISKYGLDGQKYHNKLMDFTWETCSLRKWLNSEFLNDAFNTEEKKSICITKLSTPDNPKHGTEGGNDTEDKVFLLSSEETEKYFLSNYERECIPSDYSKAQGTKVYDNGNCWWWLRTPARYQYTISTVYFNGGIDLAGGISPTDKHAVRPAMWVDLSAFEE